ncbi:hypothetical protein [Mycobacteroides abscessus]|uniref:hypothetical protein n=1 Tax=Mycobacteroides abscessus TaxID=36809 RepID=UPI00092A8141|nr:hypothetical protein [Mycobacteroides abscessus]SIE15908.1 Uncharacterised protein [Mycobacteroides abscessus subsp. abscessus]
MSVHFHAAQPGVPLLPECAQFPARHDAIPRLGQWMVQPHVVLRPVYWWAQQMVNGGYGIRELRFDAKTRTALFVYESPERLVNRLWRRDFQRITDVADLPSLITEYVWRMCACGWGERLDELVSVMRSLGLVQPARRAAECAAALPGRDLQPDEVVRAAFWRVRELVTYGWRVRLSWGADRAGGFLAELPSGGLLVYPADMADDGTAAAALAILVGRLDLRQFNELAQLVDPAAASEGRAAAGPGASP